MNEIVETEQITSVDFDASCCKFLFLTATVCDKLYLEAEKLRSVDCKILGHFMFCFNTVKN